MNADELMQVQDPGLFLQGATAYVQLAVDSGLNHDHAGLATIAERLCLLDEDLTLQSELIADIAAVFYTDGKPESGLTVAENGRRFALANADLKALSRALTLIGVFAADTGNLPQAMESYADALGLAQRLEDKLQEGKVLQNLAAALVYSGLFSEAIVCVKRALLLASQCVELNSFVSGMYCNLALCHLNLGETAQGLQAIKRAQEHNEESHLRAHALLNRVLFASYHARLLINANQFAQASDQAKLAQRFADEAQTPRTQISASIAVGLSQVFTGQVEAGIMRLTTALELAIQLKVASREVFFALVKAHEHLDQHDQALEYLQKMLEAQRNTQRANVLQHVKRHLDQLKSSDPDNSFENSTGTLEKIEKQVSILESRIAQADLNKLEQERFIARIEIMERLAVAAELRDDESGLHAYRVGRLAQFLATEVGCSPSDVFMIDIAARLHDIGKVGIPDAILLKPGQLNKSEREVMKTHAALGADVLKESGIPHIQMAVDIAQHHHEWWDGSGYPNGLKGEAIPLAARITAISEVFDTLTHARTYKRPWPIDSALVEILSLRGRQFDPILTDKFVGLMTRLGTEQVNLEKQLCEGAAQSRFLLSRQRIRDKLS